MSYVRSKEAKARNNAKYHATEKGKASIARASEIRKAKRAIFLEANPPPPPIGREESRRRWLATHSRPDYLLRHRYNLTHDELLALQAKTACAICGREDQKLVIDHHHGTGQVRDRLCRYCNIIVGAIENAHFEKAIEYVNHHSQLKRC